MGEAGPEIPRVEELVGEEEHGHHDRYGRYMAIAIVVTTLIGALVAFVQAGTLRTHDQADARAEKYGALALDAAAVNRGQAQVQIDRLNLLGQQVRAASNASLFQTYGTASKQNRLTATRWSTIATQTEADTAAIAHSEGIAYICSPSIQHHCPATNASFSPEQDPRFPARYMQQNQWSAYRLTALRDAANQEADNAEGQFVHYAATLTMLAVAVFLLGYSLTPQGKTRRRLYSRVAGSFVLVAGVWALVQAISPVAHPPDSAARAFANGEVELNTGAYPSAVTDFNRALGLRPEFVDAYAERAQAEYGAGFPSTGTGSTALPTTAGPATVPSIGALDHAVADDQRAHDGGSGSATLLFDLGKDLFYRGVLKHSGSDLRASHDDLSQSVAKLKSQDNTSTLLAAAYLRLAEDDLALGATAANTEFRSAETELRAPGVPKEATVAAALTDLSLIEVRYPNLTTSADGFRRQIVAAALPTPASGVSRANTTPVQMRGISAQPDPGHAFYTIDKPGSFNPKRDSLSAQWEYRDPLHGEWAALPEISGPVGPGGLQPNYPGYASTNSAYVSSSSPATCLPPGKYKIELYVNGQLAGSATIKESWAPLHAVRFVDVDGAMCVPNGWQPLGSGDPGTDGYLAKDQSSGAVILSIPKAASPLIANDQPGLASIMQGVAQGLAGPGNLLPGLKSSDKPQSTPFFMGASNGQSQDWTYQHGTVITGVGTSPNGEIYIGVTWGPAASGDLTQQLFYSLSPL